MSIFKSYDIRGIYNEEWNKELAYRIGFFLPSLLKADEILIGRDIRESSDEIFSYLSKGIMAAGGNVCDIGLCCTPAVYFATSFYNLGGSVMITASHNPPQYNGLKISARESIPVGYGSGLEKLEEFALSSTPATPVAERGSLRSLDIRKSYIAHLAPYKKGIGAIKAVIDCSDGMAGVFIHDVIRDLPGEIITMYDTPDGTFPHHEPNPLDERNLSSLKIKTLKEKADLGICFDGDADRVMFIDEAGNFISPDLITALLGIYFFKYTGSKENLGSAVTYDVRSSRSVVEFIDSLGGKPVICRVGHSHAKKLLRETGGIFGGELAGHYYFRDNFFCDSAMIAALIVLNILTREGIPISQLMAGISKYHFSGELNFTVNDKDRIINSISNDYRHGRSTTIDGIRIDFTTWWFSLRKSNTEPYLRLVVEAESAAELKRTTNELKEKIKLYDS